MFWSISVAVKSILNNLVFLILRVFNQFFEKFSITIMIVFLIVSVTFLLFLILFFCCQYRQAFRFISKINFPPHLTYAGKKYLFDCVAFIFFSVQNWQRYLFKNKCKQWS